ncbi:MAG: ATP-grasp domain-containing protein [Candidatus Nomurabacteria bacterium]|nr:ATP-grasp domain-containing protein [Candidatus Nomurabacteria bacterium]
MKTLGIYYGRLPNGDGYLYPKPADRQFRECATDLEKTLLARNIALVYLCGKDSYLGLGEYSSYWQIDQYTAGAYREVTKTIKPDLIFDKGHIDYDDGYLHFFNCHELARLGRNKYTQSHVFYDFIPKTVLITKHDNLAEKLQLLPSQIIVVKPLGKNGGRGVVVGNKENITVTEFPVIAQEFIESSPGVANLADGRHDLRLYVVGGEVVLSSVRQPKPGSFLSNTSQGGEIKFASPEDLDAALLNTAQKLIAKLEKYGDSFYSLDFMFDGTKWWFIEMNDRPGFPALFQDENGEVKFFYEKFAQFIEKQLGVLG